MTDLETHLTHVDDEPTAGSENLVKSGGVLGVVTDLAYKTTVETTNSELTAPHNNGSLQGIGAAVLSNKKLYNLKIYAGNRSTANPITKVFIALRKDTYHGDLLYEGNIDFTYTDNAFHELEFDFTNEPIEYSGIIFLQIWVNNNQPKWYITSGVEYLYPSVCVYKANNAEYWSISYSKTAPFIKYTADSYQTKVFDNTITTEKIADDAITTEKISDSAITTEKIADDAITTEKISDSAITTEKIADDAITTEKISDSTITTEKIADDAIESLQIKNESVTKQKLSSDVQTSLDTMGELNGDISKILENFIDEEVKSGTGEYSSTYSTTIVTGRGLALTENKTIYKIIISLGNRVAGAITRAKIVLRKDTRSGDIIRSQIIDFHFADSSLHDAVFNFTDNPITYSGIIYMTIHADAAIKYALISPDEYDYATTENPNISNPKSCYTTSTDLDTDAIMSQTSGNDTNSYMLVYYVASYNKKLVVGTEKIENSAITQDKIADGAVTEEKLGFALPEHTNEDGVGLWLPSEFIVTVGSTLQLFYRGIVKAFNPYVYNVEITVLDSTTQRTAGHAYPRYYSLKAETANIGTYNMTINLRRNDNSIIDTKSSIIRVIAAPSSPSAQKNILMIGASVTSPGLIAGELRRRLTLTSGTEGDTVNPKGLGLSNISFIGRKTGSTVTDIHQEATGGWGWHTFVSAGVARYRFFITDGSGENIAIDDTFVISGLTFTVKEINLTEGIGNISCTYSGINPETFPTSGTFMVGNYSVNYSNAELENANPFWNQNTGSLDFANYSSLYCNNETIDILISQLGVNGTTGKVWDREQTREDIKTLARAYHSYNPNGIFIISSIAVPDPTGGFGYNYGADESLSNYYLNLRKLFELSDIMFSIAEDTEFSSYMRFCPVMQECDGENMYPKYNMNVNNRDSTKEKVGSNAYHPSVTDPKGYYMIADAIYHSICDVLSSNN